MMDIISERSSTAQIVSPKRKVWTMWKVLLGKFFIIPASMKMIFQHVLSFRRYNLENLSTKQFMSSETEISFNLIPRGSNSSTIKSTIEQALI